MKAAPNGVTGAVLALLAIFLPSALLIVGALPFWEQLRAGHPVPNAPSWGSTLLWSGSWQRRSTRRSSPQASRALPPCRSQPQPSSLSPRGAPPLGQWFSVQLSQVPAFSRSGSSLRPNIVADGWSRITGGLSASPGTALSSNRPRSVTSRRLLRRRADAAAWFATPFGCVVRVGVPGEGLRRVGYLAVRALVGPVVVVAVVNEAAGSTMSLWSVMRILSLRRLCRFRRAQPAAQRSPVAFRWGIALTDGTIHHQDIRRALGPRRSIPAHRSVPVLSFALGAPTLPAKKNAKGCGLPQWTSTGRAEMDPK